MFHRPIRISFTPKRDWSLVGHVIYSLSDWLKLRMTTFVTKNLSHSLVFIVWWIFCEINCDFVELETKLAI